jgi:thiamine kinase-like enzyme
MYRNNSNEILPVSVHPHASEGERNQQIKTVMLSLCPHLLSGTAKNECSGSDQQLRDPLRITPLLGGLSNELFVVESCNSADPTVTTLETDEDSSHHARPTVLLRIHPEGEGIVDREAENRLSAWLSLQSRFSSSGRILRAPTFYGRFENGRVEEFFPNHIPLTYHDMQQYGPEAARLLSSLHSMSPPPDVLAPADSRIDDVWPQLDCWYERAVRLSTTRSEKNLRHAADEGENSIERIEKLLVSLQIEVSWLKGALNSKVRDHTAEKFGLERVLTHMDAQPLNLLLDVDNCHNPGAQGDSSDRSLSTPPHRLKLIDYEYAGFNARVLDLGNTWCEYMDMNPSTIRDLSMEWECGYPTPEQQVAFLAAYLEQTDMGEAVADDDFLSHLQRLVNEHSLISHLLWATWSCLQRHLSPIEFDYLQYAENRMQTYQHFRSVFFPDSTPGSAQRHKQTRAHV